MTQLAEAQQRRAESFPAAVTLVALTAMAPLTVDMFLPSLPTMTTEFGAAESTMQLAVTLFIVCFAGSQLVYGPASDRYGRRPVLLTGLTIYVLGSVVAFSANSASTAARPSTILSSAVIRPMSIPWMYGCSAWPAGP